MTRSSEVDANIDRALREAEILRRFRPLVEQARNLVRLMPEEPNTGLVSALGRIYNASGRTPIINSVLETLNRFL